MDTQRHTRLRDAFDALVDLDPAQQQQRLAQWDSDDPDLATRLRGLLHHERHASVIDTASNRDAALSRIRQALPFVVVEGGQIGPFQIGELLGVGGMGRVYRAVRVDGQVEQTVAIKFIRQEAVNPELLQRFSSERRMLAALDHPGISRFIDAGVFGDDLPYVVMELVEGVPLLDYCREQGLGVHERVRLLRRVCEAVDHAHRNLVVHRDLKSSNVLVTADGQPKLVDFGIAKMLSDGRQTQTSGRFMTPFNAAPEQLDGSATGVACDVYQVCLMAYELLSGAPAFDLEGLRASEIERLILGHPPPAMSARSTDAAAAERGLADARALSRRLSGDLDAIISRGLRKSPASRYASIAELDRDLAAFLEQRPVRARGGDRMYRLGRLLARQRLASALVGGLVLTWLVATLGLVLQAWEITSQRNLALLERDRAQAVVGVLREAFFAADPARSGGADVPVRRVLNAAREHVDSLADSQPELYVALAGTFAQVDLDMASDTEAVDLASRALAVGEQAGMDNNKLTLLRLLRVKGLTRMDRHEEAEQELQWIDEASLPHLRTDLLLARARLAVRRHDVVAALPLFHAALEQVAYRSADDELANEVRMGLAEALRWRGDLEGAMEALNDTLAWQRARLPNTHPRIAFTQLRRLNVMSQAGAAEDSLDELVPEVYGLIEHYGEATAFAATVHASLGSASFQVGRRDEAIAHYRNAVMAWRQSLGEGHTNTLRGTYNLAFFLAEDDGASEEAEALMRNVLQHGVDTLGPEHQLMILCRARLAALLGKQGRWREALELLVHEHALLGLSAPSSTNRRWQLQYVEEVATGAGCSGDIDEPRGCVALERLRLGLQRSLVAPDE